MDGGAGEVEDAVARVPELFRSVLRERRSPARRAPEPSPSSPAAAAAAAAAVVTAEPLHSGWTTLSLSLSPQKWVDDAKKGMQDRAKICVLEWAGWCPAWVTNGGKTLYAWWTHGRVHKLVENGVPNRELDLVVFDGAFFFRSLDALDFGD